jgi:hypothetical protein
MHASVLQMARLQNPSQDVVVNCAVVRRLNHSIATACPLAVRTKLQNELQDVVVNCAVVRRLNHSIATTACPSAVRTRLQNELQDVVVNCAVGSEALWKLRQK